MIKKFIRLFHTVRYLKPIQFYYRIYFVLLYKRIVSHYKKKFHTIHPPTITKPPHLISFHIKGNPLQSKKFTFLNMEKDFSDGVDWNYNGHGKLWAFTLNYFDFINHPETDVEWSKQLINDYCDQFNTLIDGLEPYPISLRTLNWIKFFSHYQLINPKWNTALYTQLKILYWTAEYHFLANHLIENGFALVFGGYYFKNEKFYKKGLSILDTELTEQIFRDGGHFERSPMYHNIILHRILDTYNLIKHNSWREDHLLNTLRNKASLMLGWLKEVTFSNGDTPPVNDSVREEIIQGDILIHYAEALGITPVNVTFNDSGYRMIRTTRFELFIDVGDIAPDYNPAHAHSDTFNFLLNIDGQPQLTECGTSTYLPGALRIKERSTSSHNTVKINGEEQSDVWSIFRVGKRAKIIDLLEKNNFIQSSHDGYAHHGIIHSREWTWTDKAIFIKDTIQSKEIPRSEAFIHFHPNVKFTLQGNKIDSDLFSLELNNAQNISVHPYEMANGFNRTLAASYLRIEFGKELLTTIHLK